MIAILSNNKKNSKSFVIKYIFLATFILYLFCCCFFYNTGCIRHVKPEKLDKMVIFKQPGGSMLVADCMVSKQVKGMKIYEGNGNARFRDIIYCGKAYEPGEVKPGACVFKMDVPHDVKLAN